MPTILARLSILDRTARETLHYPGGRPVVEVCCSHHRKETNDTESRSTKIRHVTVGEPCQWTIPRYQYSTSGQLTMTGIYIYIYNSVKKNLFLFKLNRNFLGYATSYEPSDGTHEISLFMYSFFNVNFEPLIGMTHAIYRWIGTEIAQLFRHYRFFKLGTVLK